MVLQVVAGDEGAMLQPWQQLLVLALLLVVVVVVVVLISVGSGEVPFGLMG